MKIQNLDIKVIISQQEKSALIKKLIKDNKMCEHKNLDIICNLLLSIG